jgi:putative ABC transport system permease protein
VKKGIAPTPNPILHRPFGVIVRLLRESRVGWRQLVADPLASAIVIFGLALAIACCQLVAQVVLNEVRPDTDVPDPSRVVDVETRDDAQGTESAWSEGVPSAFGDALRRALPPGALATRTREQSLQVRVGERADNLAVMFADPQAAPLFGLDAERGDVVAALRLADTIVLTRAAATRLFGSAAVVGRTLRLHGRTMTVAAVMTRPSTTLMRGPEALASFDSPANAMGKDRRDSGLRASGHVYARLAPGQSAQDFGRVAQAVFEGGSPSSGDVPPAPFADRPPRALVRAMPITQRYLDGADAAPRRAKLYSLVATATLILLLAVANYVNLTMVRTLARSREMAVRKSLGADPRRITTQFMLEAAVTAACAFALGVLLAWLLAPTFSGLLMLNLDEGLFAPARLAGLVVLALVLGIAAGLVPARIALGVRCAETLAGRMHDESAAGRRVRRALTTLQFTIALVISGAACVAYWQGRYIDELDLGFRGDGLVAIDLPTDTPEPIAQAFRDALSHQAGVTGLAWSSDVPARNHFNMLGELQRRAGDPPVKGQWSTVGAEFFDLYGIVPLAGRVRAPAPAASGAAPDDDAGERLVAIDTTEARALGFADPRDAVGALLISPRTSPEAPRPVRVVAVVPPVRQETAHEARRPQAFWIQAHAQSTLTLRGPDPAALKKAVETVWTGYFPEDGANPQGVVESLSWVYEEERRIGRLAACASLFALALAGFGVYALAAYTVRRSLREIVVRKLYGAGRARIAGVIARDFAPLLFVAALVGLPLTGWLVQAWLASYAVRTPLAWWSLPTALLAVVATTTLATWRHGLAAMRVRPADALRD